TAPTTPPLGHRGFPSEQHQCTEDHTDGHPGHGAEPPAASARTRGEAPLDCGEPDDQHYDNQKKSHERILRGGTRLPSRVRLNRSRGSRSVSRVATQPL